MFFYNCKFFSSLSQQLSSFCQLLFLSSRSRHLWNRESAIIELLSASLQASLALLLDPAAPPTPPSDSPIPGLQSVYNNGRSCTPTDIDMLIEVCHIVITVQFSKITDLVLHERLKINIPNLMSNTMQCIFIIQLMVIQK